MKPFTNQLDLHTQLVPHPAATFFIRIEGDSMVGAGMHSGDLLVVDRSLKPTSKKIIIALLDGEFTVRRFVRKRGNVFLVPENEQYAPIHITDAMDFCVWGVVTYVIHRSC